MYRRSEQIELDRLNELKKYEMTDGFVHVGLERIVAIAKHTFRVPIALVSLVEAERQFFPARRGLEVSETPRASSFCAHALMSRSVLIVPDSRSDPRFAENPLVTDAPHIRFYAGCPLVSPSGYVLGTLCVIDTVPRSGMDADDQRVLRDLAALVEDQLELRRATREVKKAPPV
ncbi:GAF domain-containing protein [Alcaligenaceae bacterium B3P038]|nr:GAF domain-containing protein [Alcaligenaceae bacterium B3P038]